MKAILISIRAENNINIESKNKKSELRTSPPKLTPPFKVYTYESGSLGRHKVVNEWICKDMITWRMCMGIPAHLSRNACVSNDYIWEYCDKGYKDITEMKISNLIIYDTPKNLCDFFSACKKPQGTDCSLCVDAREQSCKVLKKPPQNWCYVEEDK